MAQIIRSTSWLGLTAALILNACTFDSTPIVPIDPNDTAEEVAAKDMMAIAITSQALSEPAVMYCPVPSGASPLTLDTLAPSGSMYMQQNAAAAGLHYLGTMPLRITSNQAALQPDVIDKGLKIQYKAGNDPAIHDYTGPSVEYTEDTCDSNDPAGSAICFDAVIDLTSMESASGHPTYFWSQLLWSVEYHAYGNTAPGNTIRVRLGGSMATTDSIPLVLASGCAIQTKQLVLQ